MKILLASDGSANALDAAKFIKGLAPLNEIEVHLVQVLGDPNMMLLDSLIPVVTAWRPTAQEDETPQVSQSDHQVFETLAKDCRGVSMSYPKGDACQWILAEAEMRDVDMIVMGARGHSMLDRVLLGSVSEYVASHANCSVVVVRPTEQAIDTKPLRQILVAYDRSQPAYEAAVEVLRFAWADETEINVLSVATPGLPVPSGLGSGDAKSAADAMRRAGEQLAGRIGADVRKTSNQVIQSRHAGDAIVQATTETPYDLVVVGESGHGAIGQWILGSTTKHVLRHAPCSVWVSRGHRKSKAKPQDLHERLGHGTTADLQTEK